MIDNPTPDIETVREIVEQIARGLRAFHRLEMLHQDLRPENIMIDSTGTVKIIDFGSPMKINLSVVYHFHLINIPALYIVPCRVY
jgi:serine/threonine protein kinase